MSFLDGDTEVGCLLTMKVSYQSVREGLIVSIGGIDLEVNGIQDQSKIRTPIGISQSVGLGKSSA